MNYGFPSAQAAHNPDLARARGQARPLTAKEQMQRANAVCASTGDPRKLGCSGQVFVGLFFDGTGNNRQNDYIAPKIKVNGSEKIGGIADRKHSNIVRLFHTYPPVGRNNKGTAGYYPYYIPGVGTPFPQIGDKGGTLGSAAAWYGEPRLIWGLIQVLNAGNLFVTEALLIPDDQAQQICNSLGGLGSWGVQRRYSLGRYWPEKLKASIAARKPEVEQLNVSVFGFSRGAASARACVNWLYELCEQKDGGYTLAGIPLRVQFVGLLDTVASVGLAGMYSFSEGRQSWASDNMQIHPGVEECLQFVAAHEARACFPLDSLRIDGNYPPNCKEYVYPGMHSDVGGGYHAKAQGKFNEIACIPGYDMYVAAMAAGVPLIPMERLKETDAKDLTPSKESLEALGKYYEQAKVSEGQLEKMVREHMSWYFSYRWQMTQENYKQQPFYKSATENIGMFPKDPESLLDTQQSFMNVLAGVRDILDGWSKKDSVFWDDELVPSPYATSTTLMMLSPGAALLGVGAARTSALGDSNQKGVDERARDVVDAAKRWRQWADLKNQAEVHDAEAPERDMMYLVDALKKETVPQSVSNFFNTYVHDSMAGFAGSESVNEFLLNGFGIAKFRRTYYGNKGDVAWRKAVEKDNEDAIKAASAKRSQRAKWDAESREWRRTQPVWSSGR